MDRALPDSRVLVDHKLHDTGSAPPLRRPFTVGGDLGSGKSTVAGQIAHETGLPLISTGALQREIATKMGMSTLELNEYAEDHREIDEQIDEEARRIGVSGEPVVFDSRLAWHFVPSSVKIYLSVAASIGSRRIRTDRGRTGEQYDDAEEALTAVRRRRASEERRFRDYYGIEVSRFRNYDLVVDTSFVEPTEVTARILEAAERVGEGRRDPEIWVSPRRLLPSVDIGALRHPEADEVGTSIAREGFDPGWPVEIVRSGALLAVVDGHRRTSAAVRAGVDLIPARLAAEFDERTVGRMTADEFCHSEVRRPWVFDWESAHGLRFPDYPWET